MDELIITALQEINSLSASSPDLSHYRTGDIRKISSELFQSLKSSSIDRVFYLCEELLEQRRWEPGVIAYDWAYRMRKAYRPSDFDRFEAWLIRYVRSWGDCDDFCTHAFGELLNQYPELVNRVLPWTLREEFWMRRAAAVILILSIRKGCYERLNPLHISDLLMQDHHDLVLKGYGWMLKVLSQQDSDAVYQYLLRNKNQIPRTAYRYALEKMNPARRSELMSK
jgi:3-methyladenine DNA glycosylase AlkD